MPAKSERQRKFFQAVKGAKHNANAPANLKKVAGSMSDKDIDDFIKCESEFKVKKAILSVLKDIREPMYLNEGDDGQESADVVANTFNVKADWASYIKPYIGQPLSPKELEALGNFKEKQPTTIARTEIWYKTTDSFSASHTTVIKKMKDSGQFSFTAFQKQEQASPENDKAKEMEQQSEPTGMDAGSPELPQDGESPEMPSPEPKKEEPKKDDIIITKSILFKDDIKGASILIDFLKKLDL
jgi:hypothetical protein